MRDVVDAVAAAYFAMLPNRPRDWRDEPEPARDVYRGLVRDVLNAATAAGMVVVPREALFDIGPGFAPEEIAEMEATK